MSGLDTLIVGPAGLAALSGFGANQQHLDLRAKVIATVGWIKAAGRPVGLLTGDKNLQLEALAAGNDVVTLGVDVGHLARSAGALRKWIKTA